MFFYEKEDPEWSDELTDRANKVVSDYVLSEYVKENEHSWGEPDKHLSQCNELAFDVDVLCDGVYGCETGCEFFRVEGIVSCPHGFSTDYDFGEFGELFWSIDGFQEALKE